jgi:hypothetical protein
VIIKEDNKNEDTGNDIAKRLERRLFSIKTSSIISVMKSNPEVEKLRPSIE